MRKIITLICLVILLSISLLAQTPPTSLINLSKILGLTPAIPVMHVDTLALSASNTGTPTVTLTLSATPIAAMGGIINFSSSQVGGNVMTGVPNLQSSIVFTLPSYSFTAADIITVTYWSTK